MSKKHWIYIKRGLSEDPKHREAMGNKIWLYMHIIDQADWESGIVREWRDKDQADDMQMQLRTVRDQRQELEKLGYITCKQGRGKQQITITKWIDPRNYSGKILNNGDTKVSPSEFDGDTNGDTNGDTDGSTQNVTTSLYPKAKGQRPSDARKNGARPIPILGVSTTREIQDRYCELLGRKPKNWASGESTAAKEIAESYTSEQLSEAYQHYKSQTFWRDKRLTLRYLAQQMPEFFNNGHSLDPLDKFIMEHEANGDGN